ncbi:MAG: hypothetical protein IPM59_02050 [Chloracidobacterium sp.]|nr:hypothetical protein [Chloracidobacterium sp.]
MPSKYDTNPLDPEFPEKVGATQVLGQANAETHQFPPPASTEEQTRKFSVADVPYSPPFNGQTVPAPYSAGPVVTPDRKIDKLGLPENVLTAVPYIPWYLGLIAGLIILFVVPKSEAKVRFHAAQGLAAHIGILIVTTILGVIGEATDVANIGNLIFTLVTSIMLVVFAIKAWQGKPVHIESIEDLTNWLEDKISPRA